MNPEGAKKSVSVRRPEADERKRIGPVQIAEAIRRRILKGSGRTFRETPAGRFTVFTRITPGWHPASTSYVFVPG